MSWGGLVAVLAGAANSREGPKKVSIPATKNGSGLDGITYVRNWAGGWKREKHAANVFAAVAAGHLGPWWWVPVQVDPRLTVYVMNDAIAIGDSPRARIPLNASNYQRLADRLGKQLGKKLLAPTPKIVEFAHLAAVNGNGRAIEAISANVFDKGRCPPLSSGKSCNKGQDVEQWLRAQEAIRDAISKAGGYPAFGLVSTVGKDNVTAPRLADVATLGHVGGEASGPKLLIQGWATKPPGGVEPHTPELKAAGWRIIQGESAAHTDQDTNADQGLGGFWDYSQTERYVLDDCLLDGKPASLSTVYATLPELVYVFHKTATKRSIPTRYPMVPVPP